MGVEFDENGIYHLLKDKKRQTIDGMDVMKYTYNPSKENNLQITEKSSALNATGEILFINDDEIKIELNVSESYTTNSRLTRMKD